MAEAPSQVFFGNSTGRCPLQCHCLAEGRYTGRGNKIIGGNGRISNAGKGVTPNLQKGPVPNN